MGTALYPLIRWAPALTLAAFLLPIGAGLLGTLLPAFGYLPAIGGDRLSLAPWHALLAWPGFAESLRLTVVTGLLATVLSVAIALGFCALAFGRPWARRASAWIAPLLATPHSALAIGFAFMIAPSGWIARLVSPWPSGWDVPPDVATVGHPSGLALVLALLLKEVPYLVLMTVGALNQVPAGPMVTAARTLGYGRVQAWIRVVLPQIYRQIRLPIYAVLAFSLSVVDVALIVGPNNPPTLAVQAVRWFTAPDVALYFPAAAAACLLLLLVVAAIGLWHLGERLVARLGIAWLERGARRGPLTTAAAAVTGLAGVLFLLAVLALVALALWSVASQWRFPADWPQAFTLSHWMRQLPGLERPAVLTAVIGAGATLIALALTAACLENEQRRLLRGAASVRAGKPGSVLPDAPDGGAAPASRRPGQGALWALYLPLLAPQIAFLFGIQVLLVRLGLDGTVGAVIWVHLVFVLPYLFLSLADPWRALDARYARSALSLGASPWRVLFAIKLPILAAPVLIACAVAFAVSAGQYLPTLFAGSGRIATLTTEAVTLAAGADRRVIGVWAMMQAAMPLLVYLGAVLVPALAFARRRGLARW